MSSAVEPNPRSRLRRSNAIEMEFMNDSQPRSPATPNESQLFGGDSLETELDEPSHGCCEDGYLLLGEATQEAVDTLEGGADTLEYPMDDALKTAPESMMKSDTFPGGVRLLAGLVWVTLNLFRWWS